MFVLSALIPGILIGIVDAFIIKKPQKRFFRFLTIIIDTILSNALGLLISDFIYKNTDRGSIFPLSEHPMQAYFSYAKLVLGIGFVAFVIFAFFEGLLYFKHNTSEKNKKLGLKIVSIILVLLGTASFTGTIWGKETFGNLAADQLIINLITPKEGTSEDIMTTLVSGPILQTISVVLIFALFVFSTRELFFKYRNKEAILFSSISRKILCIFLTIYVFVGGCTYGIIKFELINIFKMYCIESDFIENNYVDPRNVNMQFPEKKRNLIHIYLESMENSYTSIDMGGYMNENLIKPLTDLAEEGISFSHLANGFGGPVATTGCVWSVASMVNMNAGIPMKVPTDDNSYGEKDNFMPGVIALGDILESQGYEQTLMFGATAKFGGLNFFYESHGNFNILDYDAAKEKGWIPNDYSVWWGYEDDKLYEFAKKELTRLYKTGKPFNFVMETADTHSPDGYVGPNTPTPQRKPICKCYCIQCF